MNDLITTQETPPANLPQLTARILIRKQNICEHYLWLGHDLIEARKLVPHGQWESYLQDEVGFTRSTANKLMTCWERFGSNVALTQHLGKNMTNLFEILALPKGTELDFIETKAAEGTPVEDMTQKAVREAVAEWKKTVKEKDKTIAEKDKTIATRDKTIKDNTDAYQHSLSKLNEEHKKKVDALNKELADAQKELEERPQVEVEPDDYQSTKTKLAVTEKELLNTKVALELSKTDAQKQAEAFAEEKEKMQADFDKSDEKKNKKIKKLTERLEAKDKVAAQKVDDAPPPTLFVDNGINFVPDEPYKLLLTDPPYSTDVDDIKSFAENWLPNALRHVRRDGFAYVFIGAYPDELCTYLSIKPPENLLMCQVLVWTYRNTLGNNPKDRYKQNWQACLFYRGVDAPALNCPITNEQWAVQDINAPDGRLDNRYHTWQKPDEIAERFIRHSTQAGDTVFDPFACTGTFLLAATRLGRKAYGFEINPDNAAIAFKRGCANGGHI